MSFHETENDIQNAILQYLELKRHCFWRQNTTAIYDPKRGIHRKPPPYALNGVSDIVLIKNGLAIFLEVKKPEGRQSPSQKTFEQKVTNAGAEYHVVRSIEDVQALGL